MHWQRRIFVKRSLTESVIIPTSVRRTWEDIEDVSCRDFIEEYITAYPSRPMVLLKVGQIIKTEWEGTWWRSRVEAVDGSLVRILFLVRRNEETHPSWLIEMAVGGGRRMNDLCVMFDADQDDKRSEWIYRGSTRLEPMFNLKLNTANTQEKKLAGQQRTRPSMGTGRTRHSELSLKNGDELKPLPFWFILRSTEEQRSGCSVHQRRTHGSLARQISADAPQPVVSNAAPVCSTSSACCTCPAPAERPADPTAASPCRVRLLEPQHYEAKEYVITIE